KLLYADSSWWETACEGRKLPRSVKGPIRHCLVGSFLLVKVPQIAATSQTKLTLVLHKKAASD
ncbi:hypothetical protein, partial [Lacticaseibacillus hulanensis]|uniref:hypothetical protein n=1 Tax=Lacticaseibacillus hulanensis TaxID=2493111 RepID=UPI0019D4B47B